MNLDTPEIKAATKAVKDADSEYKAASATYHHYNRPSLYLKEGVRAHAFYVAQLFQRWFHANNALAQLKATHKESA